MNRLINHIEYLLRNHNCVIVPNLGGFVVNNNTAKRDGLAALHAPYCDLVFNKELTHNDGLLVQSYMKTHALTSEDATKEINEAVTELRHKLREKKSINLGDIGTIKMNSESQLIYLPKPFIRPDFFGLGHTSLKPVIQLRTEFEERTKQKGGRNIRRNAIITTAAASIVGLIMFVFPLQDNPMHRQQANVFSENTLLEKRIAAPENKIYSSISENNLYFSNPASVKANTESTITTTDSQITNSVDEKKFYIVLGVYQNRKGAEKITERLKSQGFNRTAWLERSGKIRVYTDSFSDRDAAELYLREIWKKYPEYSDAWILKFDK